MVNFRKSIFNGDPDPQPNVLGFEPSGGFSLRFWLLILLTGAGAGLSGAALMGILRVAQHWAWNYRRGDFLGAVEMSRPATRVMILLLAGLLVAVTRLYLRWRAGSPGESIAEAIWFNSGKIPLWRTIVKGLVAVIAVGFGAAVGREGPPKEWGAALGCLFSNWARLSSCQRRLLVACGAGAGIAAIYNVPLGGALFALEVLLGQLSISLVLPAVAASVTGVAVAQIFLPGQALYFFPVYNFSFSSIGGVLLLSGLAVGASILFVQVLTWIGDLKLNRLGLVLAPLIVFGCLGSASIFYPELLGNGKDVVQLAFNGELAVGLLAVLLLARPVATLACVACGTPGGLFTPTLTVGALLGGLFGHFWHHFFPGETAAAYAIFGAGAFLAATTKGPISSAVFIFEMTNHVTELAVPMLVGIAAATVLARRFEARSIYSARIHQGKLEAKTYRDAQIISSATPYAEMLKQMLLLPHPSQALYVIDEKGKWVGQITRQRSAHAEKFARPLEAASADDIAIGGPTLPDSLSPAEMNKRLQEENLSEMPVIESSSNRLLKIWHSPGDVR